MGKPIVTVGDTTAHGGAVTVGALTVLAGGKPVARIGDPHTCPMVTPGMPSVPHVGGPVAGPGAPTVFAEGRPVALLGDQAVCVGPPDVLAMGCPTVQVLGTVVNVQASPQAITLRQAAKNGTPFCEKCEAAQQALGRK